MQYIDEAPWMPALGINYSLGIDGLSLLLIVLSVFTTLVVILATWDSIHYRVSQYLAAFLIMQGLLVGVFAATDAIVFYIFWEATLIPMYLIIGIWGSSKIESMRQSSFSFIPFWLRADACCFPLYGISGGNL